MQDVRNVAAVKKDPKNVRSILQEEEIKDQDNEGNL